MPIAAQVFDAVDAVVIAASTSAHSELIRLAAEARLPIFCEKPISLDLESTDEAIALVRSSGVELQVGFQRRFDPGYRAARDMVRPAGLGELYTCPDNEPRSGSFAGVVRRCLRRSLS